MDGTKTAPGPEEPWLSCTEVAAALDVDRGTVRRWVKGGYIDYWSTPTGRIRIPKSQVARITAVRKADGTLDEKQGEPA